MNGKSRRYGRVLAIALSLLGATSAVAQSTSWVGLADGSWHNPANWTAGVPTTGTIATVGTGFRPCVVQGSAAQPPAPQCAGLIVLAGAQMTVDGELTVFGDIDVGATIAGNGSILARPKAGATSSLLQCASGTSVPNLSIEGPPHRWTITSATVRGGLTTFAAIDVTGTLHVQGGATLGRQPSQTRIAGTLGSVLIIDGPATANACDIAVHTTAMTILVRTTATLTPSAGAIIVFPGRTLAVTSQFGGGYGAIEVPATSTLRIGPDLGGNTSVRAQIQSLRCDGQALVLNPIVGDISGTGSVSLTNLSGGPASLQSISGPVAVTLDAYGNDPVYVGGSSVPFVVPTGASLTLGAGLLLFFKDVDVQGQLAAGPGAQLLGLGSSFQFTVRPTGLLRLVGTSTQPARIWGYDSRFTSTVGAPIQIRLQGQFEAQHFSIVGIGGGGIRCEPGSTFGAAHRVESGWLVRDFASPGPLLDFARTASTTIGPLTLDGPSGTFVRATTPYAVTIDYASGLAAGIEDDPLGVITWHQGQTYFGRATPGCRGVAECEANGRANLGNSSFAIFTDNAHPTLGGIRAFGFGGRSTPLVSAFVDIWLDPALPISTLYYASDPTGRLTAPLPIPNNPTFLNAVIFAQWLLLEPVGCRPAGLSGSTALRFVVVL